MEAVRLGSCVTSSCAVREERGERPLQGCMLTEACEGRKIVPSRPTEQREHSVPKAATKLAAAPSTLLASNSKAPVTVPKSSFPTTCWPTENAALTVTVLDYGGPENREKPNNLPLTMASTDRNQKQGNQLEKRSVSFFAISQKPLSCGSQK